MARNRKSPRARRSATPALSPTLTQLRGELLRREMGMALQEARVAAGNWSQKELAERAGIDASLLSKVERGQRAMSRDLQESLNEAFAGHLDTSLDRFMFSLVKDNLDLINQMDMETAQLALDRLDTLGAAGRVRWYERLREETRESLDSGELPIDGRRRLSAFVDRSAESRGVEPDEEVNLGAALAALQETNRIRLDAIQSQTVEIIKILVESFLADSLDLDEPARTMRLLQFQMLTVAVAPLSTSELQEVANFAQSLVGNEMPLRGRQE